MTSTEELISRARRQKISEHRFRSGFRNPKSGFGFWSPPKSAPHPFKKIPFIIVWDKVVKSLLLKRQRLRKRGHFSDANVLAAKINELIRNFRAKQLSNLSEASPKALWTAVSGGNKKSSNTSLTARICADIDSVNNYFASVCSTSSHGLDDVLCFYRRHINPHSNDFAVSALWCREDVV